jgi:hypothetical protein
MDGDEPQMGDAGLEDGVHFRLALEPIRKRFHLGVEARSLRSLVVNGLFSDRS